MIQTFPNLGGNDLKLSLFKSGKEASSLIFWLHVKRFVKNCTVSILRQDKRYMAKAKPEGTPYGKGLYLTIYPKLSHNKDNISF